MGIHKLSLAFTCRCIYEKEKNNHFVKMIFKNNNQTIFVLLFCDDIVVWLTRF